jgi:hypothetical protein
MKKQEFSNLEWVLEICNPKRSEMMSGFASQKGI